MIPETITSRAWPEIQNHAEALNPKRYRLLDFQLQPREAPRDSSGLSVAPMLYRPGKHEHDTNVAIGPRGVLGAAMRTCGFGYVWCGRKKAVLGERSAVRASEACHAVFELSQGLRLAHSVKHRRAGVAGRIETLYDGCRHLAGELKFNLEGVDG
ncbi:hypothetical protein [Sorangium atrum]|uniref:Uncharacterized protein n=1 Tax=Sorangium atrum TaxID=2995308 RepID=A0ABT5CEQ5_9BACT|nr:hypothetical protein [Sorangium aterium]MDC0684852.1 hypothetical protein [Sorangium aterium]